jgi:Tfp pilus assembly protein PilV
MRRRARRKDRGISLLEALVAISLFAITASAFGTLAIASMRNSIENRQASIGAFLAQQELERQRGLEYSDVADSSQSQSVNGAIYTVAAVVSNNTPAAGMKQVVVTSSWTGPGGPRSYVAETILTDITL